MFLFNSKHEYFGKYILLERIASGGMAEVFMARAPGAGGIGKIISMKRILPQYTDNQDFLDMFKAEAKIAINLSHSNVVSIYEFGIENQQLFIAMEYVEGKNIRQLLNHLKKIGKKLTFDQIVYIIKEVAAGLDHAHKCIDGTTGKPLNIIHRDMSPQNIMTSFDGEIKIVDFGIAKAESQVEKTKAGTLKGKFGYMSPEQAQGLEVDIRTDIFSLGIVLWELLANERLFVANNEINTLRKIRDCNIPSIKKINPSIHPELERIVNKSLVKDRNLRYQYASELNRDLNRFLNRQYPDFSRQDFSMFVSGIYADEIIEIRNRIVEYSQIPFQKPNNNSLQSNNKEDKNDSAFLELITGTNSSFDGDKTVKATPGKNSVVTEGSKKYDFSKARLKSENPFFKSKYKSTNTKSVVQPSYVEFKRLEKKRNSFIQFLIFVAIFGGIYYLYQSGLMSKSINSASSFSSTIMKKQNNLKKIISQPGQEAGQAINKIPTTPNSAPQEQPSTTTKIVINSSPSGAKIYLNGVDTKKITPSQISVPYKKPFNIVLRKLNYIDYLKEGITINAGSSRTFNTTMQKALISYLTIDARPSRNVKLYVNGKPLSEKTLPIRNYAVRSDSDIIIKATNPYKGITKYKRINLKVGEKKSVIFDLNSKARQPTSTRRRRK